MVITVTITDITQAGRSIADLIANGTGSGYTVAPANRVSPSALVNPLINRPRYLSVQNSPSNASNVTVYLGDENTKNDGSCQGKELTQGVIDSDQSTYEAVHLAELYVRANANGAKINIEAHWA